MARRTLFLTWLGLLCLISPVLALPAHLLKDNPAAIATFHCRQIYASADDSRLLTPDSLNQLAGSENLNTLLAQEELNAIRQEFGAAPDFGFLLEGRWQALTRDERKRFNELTAAAIRRTYGLLENGTVVDKCHAKLLTPVEKGRPDKPLPDIRYARTALTVQKEDGAVAFIPVLYLFRKPSEAMWQIEDMQLGQVSLRTHMAKILPERISSKGFAGILRDLSAIAEGHRKPGDYFPL